MDEQKPKTLVSAEENADVSRAVRQWLNTYPDKPLSKLDFEWLGEKSGLCISTIQAAYKTKKFIDGSYQAQYLVDTAGYVLTFGGDRILV